MGREIRRVPPDWQHPIQECPHMPWWPERRCSLNGVAGKCYRPLYDKPFREVAAEWKADYAAWERGERPGYFDAAESGHLEFWEWENGPPDREDYRPDWPEGAATAYQMYETVSEGTPVSPVFATEAEIVEWLVGQGRTRHAAEQFVRAGWAPSLVVVNGVMASNEDAFNIIPGPRPHEGGTG
jgi:hypothetical protein